MQCFPKSPSVLALLVTSCSIAKAISPLLVAGSHKKRGLERRNSFNALSAQRSNSERLIKAQNEALAQAAYKRRERIVNGLNSGVTKVLKGRFIHSAFKPQLKIQF